MWISWLLLIIGIGISTTAHYFPDSGLLEALGLVVLLLAMLRIVGLQLAADSSAKGALPLWIALAIFGVGVALFAVGFWRTEYWFLLKVGVPFAGGGLGYLSLRFLGYAWGKLLLLGVGVGLVALAAFLYPGAFARVHPAYHVALGALVVIGGAVTALTWRSARSRTGERAESKRRASAKL